MPTMNLSMNMNMGGGMPNYLRGPPPNMGNPMMRPQNNYNQPPPNMPNMMNPPPLMQGGQNPMGMQMGMGGGYPVMPPQGYPMQQFGGPPPTHMEQPISDHEFEEIMQRNHIVCSTAISRAVSDAATGDYRSAVETLLTAVSLIRQSRTAKHDRCKALISSLEDTIRGIESKQYSSSSSRKHRRSRSRSPDSRSRKHRRRSRSRSHDRYDYSPRRTSRY
uniref:Cleavage and polyadenylation specificity factor subunit 6 n=1 Tax=Panagrellus redivivus TaxID=6233 RepID=A0A7E4VCB2_PANRE